SAIPLWAMFDLACRAIQSSAHSGMAERGQVYPDLVSAPGVDLEFQQRELAVGRVDSAADLVVRDCLAPAEAAGGHAGAAHGVAADSRVNGSPFGFQRAMHKGNIGFLNLSP